METKDSNQQSANDNPPGHVSPAKVREEYVLFDDLNETEITENKTKIKKRDKAKVNSTEIKKRDTVKINSTEIQDSSTRKGGDVWMVNNQIDVVSSEQNLYYDM